jgi:hypothetical protein
MPTASRWKAFGFCSLPLPLCPGRRRRWIASVRTRVSCHFEDRQTRCWRQPQHFRLMHQRRPQGLRHLVAPATSTCQQLDKPCRSANVGEMRYPDEQRLMRAHRQTREIIRLRLRNEFRDPGPPPGSRARTLFNPLRLPVARTTILAAASFPPAPGHKSLPYAPLLPSAH